MRMHGAQLRASGNPYFAHPIAVAGILTEYRLDAAAIVTALLHDVIEDTEATRAELARLFSDEIAELVEGVTKLSRLELQAISEDARSAENLRRFILAVSRDVRVLLVKLADRLHNMRTLEFISKPEKRERIARETLDIYAPLARAIGMHRITSELEELAFAHLQPAARLAIMRQLDTLREEKGDQLATVIGALERLLADAGVQAGVFGREKTPFSIWRKLQRKSVGFEQLSDIYAFRIIVRGEEDCYRALGAIHRTWPVVPERFKDYISVPKQNDYRSIHTTVMGPGGLRVELQIRTEVMDRIAEEGVAAHWRYKSEGYGFDEESANAAGGDPFARLRNVVHIAEAGESDPEDFVEHAKLEMFLDQLFVFTPKGQVINLPMGAMPLDFAYAVHTDIGDTTIGVKINGQLKTLHTPLQNGDLVEVVRGPKPVVPPEWRSMTTTGRARSAIRRHQRQTEREEAIRDGNAAIAQIFGRIGRMMSSVSFRPALDQFALDSEDELKAAVGRGKIKPAAVLDAVFPTLKDSERAAAVVRTKVESGKAGRHFVKGVDLPAGVPVRFQSCCHPVVGDRIVGIVQPHELDVHVMECPRLGEFDDDGKVWRLLEWTDEATGHTLSAARLRATIDNAPGALGQMCTVVGEAGANIVNLRMREHGGTYFDVDLDLEVIDATHLRHLSAALRANPTVQAVERPCG